MKYLSDLHTHTIVSGHAYNTLFENIDYCAKQGIKILGTSEHAPAMPGAPHPWYFANLRVLPRVIKGVTILKIKTDFKIFNNIKGSLKYFLREPFYNTY